MKRALAILALCGAVASSASAQTRDTWPSEGPPRPLPAHDVKFPPYDLQKLSNGLQVVVVQQHEQPAISMRLLVRAGSASDQKDKLGAGALAAELLDQGTTAKTAQQLADEIDFIGAAESSGAGTDLSYVTMVVMKDSFETGLSMLSDLARRPAFSQAEIDRLRQQTLSGMQVSRQDPEYVANSVFDRLVYGFHPYGMPQNGTPETLEAVARDDLVAFHTKYFAPNNAFLAIVGDITPEEAFASAKKILGDWAPKAVPPQKYMDPPDPTRRVVVVDKPDAVQTEVRVGHIGVPRSSPDYMALNLAIRILGGEGSNRLHQVLRTERGLTYGAQASMDTLKESGDFKAQTNTRTEATGEVLRLIVDEFWRLQRERVSERELNDAKAYMTGSFPLTIETPEAIAMQILNVLFYDLPIEQLQNYRDRVNAITPDDVQRVARAYLRPDRLSVVLVGNAAGFSTQLTGIGFGSFETIELSDLDLMSADLRHGHAAKVGGDAAAGAAGARRVAATAAYTDPSQQAVQQPRPAPPNTAEDGARAKALVDAVIAAKGGLVKLRGIGAITAHDSETMTGQDGQTARADTTTYLQYPDRVRVETALPDATIVQGFDGQRAWVQDPSGLHELPAPMVRQLQASLKRDTVALLLAAESGQAHVRLLPDARDERGRLRHAIEVTQPSLDPVVWYIDPGTSLISRQTYIVGGPGRPLLDESFDDYRVVDGVQMAFTARVRRAGQLMLERRIGTITFNAPMDAALFKRPAS